MPLRSIHRHRSAPPKLIAGGQYGFGFAAFLIVEKCADSIPIHRIEKRFGRLGIPDLSQLCTTMNDSCTPPPRSCVRSSARLQRRIAALEIVLADETSMRCRTVPNAASSGSFTARTKSPADSSCSTFSPPTGVAIRRRRFSAAPKAHSSSMGIRDTTRSPIPGPRARRMLDPSATKGLRGARHQPPCRYRHRHRHPSPDLSCRARSDRPQDRPLTRSSRVAPASESARRRPILRMGRSEEGRGAPQKPAGRSALVRHQPTRSSRALSH